MGSYPLKNKNHQLQGRMLKKVRPARPQALWRAERTGVREHDKGPRTLLAAFFNILLGILSANHQDPKPTQKHNDADIESRIEQILARS